MGKRGPKPGSVKRPEGAGRAKGTPNRSTRELKEIAQQYGSEAVSVLASIMRNSEADAAKIAAARELLDRGYGKATQTIAGDPENPLQMVPMINVGIGEAGPQFTPQARNGALNGSH